MTKLIVIPKSIQMIKELISTCDGFIVGLENLSVNMASTFSLEEIKEIAELTNKQHKHLFVTVNKNIHNEELDFLQQALLELDNLDIDGIMYYDIAVVNLKEKLSLKKELIWYQEHLTTNYATCNFWESYGASAAYLSSDITLQEVLDIQKNTSVKLFVTMFGYLPMFASFRHLVKNYLKTFSLGKIQNKVYKIEKEGKQYNIVDNELGSFVYSNNILNGLEEYIVLQENNFDYVVLNSFEIDDNDFTKIVNLFAHVDKNNVKEYSDSIQKMFTNVDKGFLYKETVYKVKNNE